MAERLACNREGAGSSPAPGPLWGPSPGYAAFQLAKALRTAHTHDDPDTRARAQRRHDQWQTVLNEMLAGTLHQGSRQPLPDVPVWATPEVITGGFVTGKLLAGTDLQPHERRWLEAFPELPEAEQRRALNAYFLTEAGLATLQTQLSSGSYAIAVPEEGALLVVAWLTQQGEAEAARALVAELAPFFSRLRFYPVPLAHPRPSGPRLCLQSVAATREKLRGLKPQPELQAQTVAVQVWLPLYDQMVALFLETCRDDWPCQNFPPDWAARAQALLAEHAACQTRHGAGGKTERLKGHARQLRGYLAQAAHNPTGLSGREVGHLRHILACYLAKHGPPAGERCRGQRQRQQADVSQPRFEVLAALLHTRLAAYPQDAGLEDLTPVQAAVSPSESKATGVSAGTPLPPSLQRKLARARQAELGVLVEQGLVRSAETLAQLLPVLTAGIRAAGLADPALRELDAALYRAFRRRRSLLLFNLEHQVQPHELPWIAALAPWRQQGLSERELAFESLREISCLALKAFPQALLPNPLLQELRTLATGAGLHLPLVDELAADIFMGAFSPKFVAAARLSAEQLAGSLYATYYNLGPSFQEVLSRSDDHSAPARFAQLCATRAGVRLGGWDTVANGRIIEQQQILTTQNLAVLFDALGLRSRLEAQLPEMALRCFRWLCARLQVHSEHSHAQRIAHKQSAYAWRQMLFWGSQLTPPAQAAWLSDAEAFLAMQPAAFATRFAPIMAGLRLAAAGLPLEAAPAGSAPVRRFLGWDAF